MSSDRTLKFAKELAALHQPRRVAAYCGDYQYVHCDGCPDGGKLGFVPVADLEIALPECRYRKQARELGLIVETPDEVPSV